MLRNFSRYNMDDNNQPNVTQKMKIEIISTETIKPSSKTPHRLRHFPLSFLDQLAPPIYVPLILFYDDQNDGGHHEQRSHRLKTSLSETLARFFPVLAGRLENNLVVNCNDQGVDYSEARVNCKLSDVVTDPDSDVLKLFLPCEPFGSGTQQVLLAVQTTVFECGGIAVGVCISHTIADGSSFNTFLNCWSGVARGSQDISEPQFESASLFPQRDLGGFMPTAGISTEKIVGKRFVFDASKIRSLRDKAITRANIEYPTRVEAVSSFIFRRFVAATRAKERNSAAQTAYTIVLTVNLRGRVQPPLPEQSFGNIWRLATVELPELDGDEKDWDYSLEAKMREAMRNIDCNYVRKLQEGEWYLSNTNKDDERWYKGETVYFSFSSWCRFGYYETDFGWGKPIWATPISVPFKNSVSLMDARSGDGIEAWVNLLEEDMVEFQRDQELLACASPVATSDP